MSTENNDYQKPEEKSIEKTPFWKKHFLSILLFVIVIISLAWGWIAQQNLISEHKEEKKQLIASYEASLDSIKIEKAKMITTSFALAVRSEMIDENMDQVSQYFLQMIKNEQIQKVMLVDQKNGDVLLSTNHKDENKKYKNDRLKNASKVEVDVTESTIITATPVMGLNQQMALLVIESKK